MLIDEMDWMEQKLTEFSKEVDGFTTGVNIAVATHEKIWAEMMKS